MAYDFSENGFAKVEKEDGLFYYINSELETVSEGYRCACDFSSNGFAIAKKEDGKWYYINEKFETVSKGYKFAEDFNEEGLASVQKANGKRYLINDKFELVGSFDAQGEIMSEEEFRFDLYLDGELEVYDLPDEIFAGEYLDKLIKNEKKVYEYAINMASTEEQKVKVQSDYESRADYVRGRAYEIDREKNKEKYENQTKEDILALKKKEYVGKGKGMY
jgi:actin-related protein